MLTLFKNFIRSQDGAVTVDWVVLCAAVVGIAVTIVAAMQTGALDLTAAIGTFFGGLI